MKPAGALSVTDRYKLKEFALTRSQIVQPGRIMFWQGRKVLGFGNVDDLAQIFCAVPKGTTEICVSPLDYSDIKEWIG